VAAENCKRLVAASGYPDVDSLDIPMQQKEQL
jgi:hypothetical protein